jgi:hypothetical protein
MSESFPSYQSLVVSSRFQLQQLVPFQVMPMAQLLSSPHLRVPGHGGLLFGSLGLGEGRGDRRILGLPFGDFVDR